MAAKTIELHVPLSLAPLAAREGMIGVLRRMTQASPGGHAQASLSLYLRDLHVAVKGQITVPVDLKVQERRGRWECALEIAAASDEGFFPRFTGTLSISPVGNHCELWLIGEYRPPLGAAGELLDATVLRHSAQRSLESFLSHVAAEIIEHTKNAEADYERRTRIH